MPAFLSWQTVAKTHSGSYAERRVACVGIATSSVKLEQAYVGVVQSCNGVTIALQKCQLRPILMARRVACSAGEPLRVADWTVVRVRLS